MKLSLEPTNWLIVNASAHSTWDDCIFILVNLNDPQVKRWSQLIRTLDSIYKGPGFYYYWTQYGSPVGWYTYQDGHNEIMQLIKHAKLSWWYVSFTDDQEISHLTLQDQPIYQEKVEFLAQGYMRFNGIGRQTGETFQTDMFPISVLKNRNRRSVHSIIRRLRSCIWKSK